MPENKTYTLSPEHDLGIAISARMVKGVAPTNLSHAKTGIPSPGEYVVVQGADVLDAKNYPFLSDAGEAITVASDSVLDTTASVRITGLDPAGVTKTEVVPLTGTTPVVSSGWRRINSALTLDPTPTVGNVTVRKAADAVVLFSYTPAAQQAFPGVYTVPAGFTASVVNLILGMQKSTGSNTAAVIRLYTRAVGSNVFRLEFVTVAQRDGDGSPDFDNPVPDRIPPLTDILLTAEGETAGQAVFLRSSWKLLKISAYPLDNPSVG